MSANKYRKNDEVRKYHCPATLRTDLGKNHQWILKRIDEILKKNRVFP